MRFVSTTFVHCVRPVSPYTLSWRPEWGNAHMRRLFAIVMAFCTAMAPGQSITPGLGAHHGTEDIGLGTPVSELILRGDCRMTIIGDSISNKNVDSLNPSLKSSMYWGIIRTWRPKAWTGLCIPVSNKWPNIWTLRVEDPYATTVARILRRDDPETRIFSYGYERIASAPSIDVLFDLGDMPADQTIVLNRLRTGDAWLREPGHGGGEGERPLARGRGRSGVLWFDGPLAADFVYARTPQTIRSLRVQSKRVGWSLRTSEVLDASGELSIRRIVAPPLDAGIGWPEFRIVGGDASYDEAALPDHFIWLTTRIYRTDRRGFSLDALAVGGARVREFLEDGLYADDDRLREYLDATNNPNLFYIQLGANDFHFGPSWRSQMERLIDRLDRLSADNGVRPRFLLVAPYGTASSILHEDALVAASICESIARVGTERVAEDRIAYVGLAVILGGPLDRTYIFDRIHPNRRGADYLASLIWDQIVRCRGDYTTGNDPDDPGYGVPDGTIDASDLFFFLDLFSGSDLDADLTGSSNPGDETFGDPDGIVDADDFFYFLHLFTTGCG